MSELPKGWAVAKIADLISYDGIFVDGDWVESKDQDPSGDVRLIQLADIGDGFYANKSHRFLTSGKARELGCTFLRREDVLIARMPDPLGRACLFPGDTREAVTVVDVCIVRGRKEHFDANWLMHFVNAAPFRECIHSLQSGSTRKRISRGNLSTLNLPLPPRAEQTRIVEKLEELLSDLDAGVAELKAAQKKLAQYRQSLLKAAVEGALTAEWREARRNSPSPQPLSRQGRGAMATDVLNDTGMLTPLPPRGGGAGGEGAKARQVTSPIQQQHARELRNHQTPTERDLWQQLRAKRFAGFKFRRQQPLGRYIVDFVCFEQRLIVELDGSQHADQQDYDAERDAWLQAQGFRVLRFWNNQWSAQPEAVLEAIWLGLQQEPPLPNPSPARGEGLETGAQLLERILTERRARWEAKQLAKFAEQGKTPPKDWQKKYPEPVQPDTTDLPELPEGWVWASVEQISEIQGGIQKQPSRVPVKNKYPFLRVANVARGKLKLDDVHEIELFTGELERLALVAGDILIVEGNGSLTEIGRCAIWDGSITNAVHQNHLIRLRPVGVVSQFIEAWLNSLGGIEKLTELAATTSGLYTLSVGKISKVPVPIAPRMEQEIAMQVLIDNLLILDTQEQSVELSLKQSAAQRQNILRAAFAGQLVPQDPNDEPASVLLARIRAERAAVKKPRGRKTKEANHAR